MLAMTIIIMGLGTFLVGLLPNYDKIGIAAPLQSVDRDP
jgi:MHS family shikimate/dehydroshikimate transporter-like MFS transporter